MLLSVWRERFRDRANLHLVTKSPTGRDWDEPGVFVYTDMSGKRRAAAPTLRRKRHFRSSDPRRCLVLGSAGRGGDRRASGHQHADRGNPRSDSRRRDGIPDRLWRRGSPRRSHRPTGRRGGASRAAWVKRRRALVEKEFSAAVCVPRILDTMKQTVDGVERFAYATCPRSRLSVSKRRLPLHMPEDKKDKEEGKRCCHFSFIMDQQVGLRTQYLNWQRVVARRPGDRGDFRAGRVRRRCRTRSRVCRSCPVECAERCAVVAEIRRGFAADEGVRIGRRAAVGDLGREIGSPIWSKPPPAFLVMGHDPRFKWRLWAHCNGYGKGRARTLGGFKRRATPTRLYGLAAHLFSMERIRSRAACGTTTAYPQTKSPLSSPRRRSRPVPSRPVGARWGWRCPVSPVRGRGFRAKRGRSAAALPARAAGGGKAGLRTDTS